MEKRKKGRWRVIYRNKGKFESTRSMSKREASYYYSMARMNSELGHWDRVAMVRVEKEYTDGRVKPIV